MREEITVKALSMPDGSQYARVRKVQFEYMTNRCLARYFLNNKGNWRHIPFTGVIPEDCKLALEVGEVQEG